MGRFPQSANGRGSLKWIQRAVNERTPNIDPLILSRIPDARGIEWRSPLASDAFAEYRDAAFLERIGLQSLSDDLREFWPARGPQWDALGCTDSGQVLLVEAKAHLRELCSPGSKAGEASLTRIGAALDATARALGARPLAGWDVAFYQLANRFAHLHFLHARGVPVSLVLANFVGDDDMGGPQSEEEWRAAYTIVWHVMGLPQRHILSRCVIDIFPRVGRSVA